MAGPILVQGGAALATNLPAVAAKVAERTPEVWAKVESWFKNTTAGKKGSKVGDLIAQTKKSGDGETAELFTQQLVRAGMSVEALRFVLPPVTAEYWEILKRKVAAVAEEETKAADKASADLGMGVGALAEKRASLLSLMRVFGTIPTPGRRGRPFFDIDDLMELWRFVLTTDRAQIEAIRQQAMEYPGSELYNLFKLGK